jgi:hypothetical protein
MTKRQGTCDAANYYGADEQRKKEIFYGAEQRTIDPDRPLLTSPPVKIFAF